MTRRIGWDELQRAYEATGDEILGAGGGIPALLEKYGIDEKAFGKFVVQSGTASVEAGKRVGASGRDMTVVAFARAVMVGLILARQVDES